MKFTFGTASYRDFRGVYYSIKALQIYHNEWYENSEIIVVDNAPETPEGLDTQNFIQKLLHPKAIYFPLKEPVGTAPSRQKLFELASGDVVVVFDSHVMFEVGAFDALREYFSNPENSKDIVSGPLIMDDGKSFVTHLVPKWRGQSYGIWGVNPVGWNKNSAPFEIAGMGLGAFACMKNNWPGFNPLLRGFGAEEIYIHEKIRRNGGRAVCLPKFRWHHEFRANSTRALYPLYMWHKVRNYILVYKELGWDLNEVKNYFVGGGFIAERDWYTLIEDPENRMNPPKYIYLADDEDKRKQIIEYTERNSEKKGDNENMLLPPELKNLKPEIREKVLQAIKERSQNVPQPVDQAMNAQQANQIQQVQQPPQQIHNQQNPQNKEGQPNSGCAPCQERERLRKRLEAMTKYKTIAELYLADVQSSLEKPAKAVIERYVKDADVIYDIGDDPLGSTLVALNGMKKEAVLISHYADGRYANELILLNELTKKDGKQFQFAFGPPQSIKAFRDIDFVILDFPMRYDVIIKGILEELLPRSKRCLVLRAHKYGQTTADNKPGILPAVTDYLKQHREWSVKEFDKEGEGYLLLSRVPEDKPKFPSKITMAANFVKSLAKHIVTGANDVSKEVLEKRLSICSICPHRVDNRCSVCGCYLVEGPENVCKACWKDSVCPLGYWEE